MIRTFPAVPLDRARAGLGVNLGSQFLQEWAYAEAVDAGCSEVRFQIAWSSAELYDFPGTFDLSALDAALELCVRYGLRPLVVAAYAPPWRTVKTIAADGLHPIGSTTFTTTTNVSDLQPGRDHIGGLWYQIGFGRPAYYGGIIHDIAGQVLTLGAATTGAFANGATVAVNRLLYPSVDAASGTTSAERFADYVVAMADRIAAYGLAGRIEIWNEPPWANDAWDRRSRFYDDPAGMGIATWSFEGQPLCTALAARSIPPGVGLVCAGSHKSGFHGLLRYLTPAQIVASGFVADAAHPYATFPESSWWDTTGAGTNWGAGYVNLQGAANFAFNAKLIADNPTAGLEFVISEVGTQSLDDEQKRNFDLRTLVSSWSMGFRMVNFYSLADTIGLAMVDAVTHVPRPAWSDIKRLMGILARVEANEANYALPTIQSWAGTNWDLAAYPIGPVLVAYQRTVPPDSTPLWPPPAALTLADEPGDLLVIGGNDHGHQAAAGDTVYVGARPVILTRKLVA